MGGQYTTSAEEKDLQYSIPSTKLTYKLKQTSEITTYIRFMGTLKDVCASPS